jgi:hypothetical protein
MGHMGTNKNIHTCVQEEILLKDKSWLSDQKKLLDEKIEYILLSYNEKKMIVQEFIVHGNQYIVKKLK